jgi:carbamoyltransferase
MKTIWGISGYAHDAAISVIKNKEIVFASSSERFSRIKNDKKLNSDMINYALQYGYPEKIVWYENPYKKFLRKLIIDKQITSPFIKLNLNTKISYVDHHTSHLNSCLYTSPFEIKNTLGVIVDSVGEFLSLSVWDIKDFNKKKIIYKTNYPNSLGLFYSAITELLGLKPQEDEYILMGMASYGKTYKYYNYFSKYFFKNGKLILDLRKGCKGIFSDKEIEKNRYDIALGAQKIFEDVVVGIIKKYMSITGYRNIILGGGCALNCTCNSKILELADNMWVFPNPGDSGASLGAALGELKDPIELKNMYLGYDAGNSLGPITVARHINYFSTVGVITGKAEFGPRALGNRSILADPRVKNIKEIVNNIKGREQFRPFAPIILKEHFNEYFYNPKTSNHYPYMQYTFFAKHAYKYPGIVHIDNTSRVQTVDTSTPFIYKVLKKWYSLTGCPILLNTSLNIKGKPLLNSLNDLEEFKDRGLTILS